MQQDVATLPAAFSFQLIVHCSLSPTFTIFTQVFSVAGGGVSARTSRAVVDLGGCEWLK